MSHGELNLTVGKLSPVFNDGRISGLRKLTEDFACFQASGFKWERESFCPRAGETSGLPHRVDERACRTSNDGLLMPRS